jgi:twitching motility protein PilT
MAQLDRLLSVMVSNRADALMLNEGDLGTLEMSSGPRPVTKSALTAPQVLGLLKEIAPPESVRSLDEGRPATFHYASADGHFGVQALVDAGQWRVRIAVDPNAEPRRGGTPVSNGTPTPSRVGAVPTPVRGNGAQGAPGVSPAAMPTPAAPPVKGTPVASVAAPVKPAATNTAGMSGIQLDAIPAFEGIEEARARIDALLRQLVERGASDLHLRCGEPPILRHHGEMARLDGFPVLDDATLSTMLRAIMPERNRLEFAESNDTDYAHEIPGCARFRANALKDRNGVAAVFRQIPAEVVTVEQMGISPEVQRLCYLTKGLVLVTGPTGSGKSTTLCALIDLVNRVRHDHIITIEDPIEFVHPNKNCIITQRQVGVHTKSFKAALRAALREDPDIILVGELRDLETVSIAIETAETGHLVFGTLHTTTAPGTIDRVIDQFPADRQEQIRVMLAESLKGVISQTLCKKKGGGRVAAREILLTTPSITNLVREGKTFQIPSVIQTSRRLGMVTLNDALMELVDGNLVEPKEAYMKAVDKPSLVQALKQRGHDVSFAEGDQPAKPEPPVPAKKK